MAANVEVLILVYWLWYGILAVAGGGLAAVGTWRVLEEWRRTKLYILVWPVFCGLTLWWIARLNDTLTKVFASRNNFLLFFPQFCVYYEYPFIVLTNLLFKFPRPARETTAHKDNGDGTTK